MKPSTQIKFTFSGSAANAIKNGEDLARKMEAIEAGKLNMLDAVPEGWSEFFLMNINDEFKMLAVMNNDFTDAGIIYSEDEDGSDIDTLLKDKFEMTEDILVTKLYMPDDGFDRALDDGHLISEIYTDFELTDSGVRERMPVVQLSELMVADLSTDVFIKENLGDLTYTLLIRDGIIYLDRDSNLIDINLDTASLRLISSNRYIKESLIGLPINLAEFF